MLLLLMTITIVIIALLWIYYNKHAILYPGNWIIGKTLSEQDNINIYEVSDIPRLFPNHFMFKNNWREIAIEAQNILSLSKDTNVWKKYYHAHDHFWKGWNSFTLRLYGKDYTDNMKLCPITTSLINRCPDVYTAVFSILEPGKELVPHYGPFKNILRYHLGLVIPTGECYLKVDGSRYYWKEGEEVIFDEYYLHSAHNLTDHTRIILYIDVPRHFDNIFLTLLNDSMMALTTLASYTH